ncbi:MAG: TonB-dependent receptor plug domain-containing protein, partial [Saprospiraceae bacterium]|nr:TonB-dependent receptor plug domain-containing protein [Saprospiraceae bacterium]
MKTYNIETINSGELRKAACCNLSESFETNGAVNVSYSDAVTGAKEIEMLGLRGIYTQMQVENRPSMRGLAYPFGMEYIPGTWISNISIAKGASTVVTGYEGIAGSINVALIKPFEGEKLFVNTYVNHVGRSELNVHLNHNITDKWSVGALLHGNYMNAEIDHNHDNFLDIPKKEMLNGLFRVFYQGDNLHGELNAQALTSRFAGGQIGYTKNPTELYGVDVLTERVDVFGKVGYFGFDNQFASIAWLTNLIYHQNNGFFGRNNYDATQRSFYTNFIYQNIIGTSDHNYKTGFSYIHDNYVETFADADYDLIESV